MENSIIDILLFSIKPQTDEMLQYAMEIKNQESRIKIAAFIDLSYHETLQALLQARIDGYITKDISLPELEKGLKQLSCGLTFHQSSVAEELFHRTRNIKKNRSKKHELESCLTRREVEVIQLMTEDYNTQQIAGILCLSKRTVEGYKQRIFEKTGCRTELSIAKLAIRFEWISPKRILV